MKQTEAVDVIYSLLPSMKSAAPETVLEKYATLHGLSPAQLEKLGHVFNTASTLATLERDREAAPTIMDVPSLVSGYVRKSGTAKRASFFDQDQPQVKAASAGTPTELPNVWGDQPVEERLALEKEAKDYRPIKRQVFERALNLAELAVEEAATSMSKYAAVIDQVARQLAREEQPLLKVATLLADIEGLSSEIESDMVRSKLAAALEGFGLDIISSTVKSAPVILHRDRTGMYAQVKEGLDHLKLAIDARAALSETLELAGQMAAGLEGDWDVARQATKQASRLENLMEAAGLIKEASPDKKKDDDRPSGSSGAELDKRINNILYPKWNKDKNTGTYYKEPALYTNRDLIGPALGSAAEGAASALRGGHSFLTERVPDYLRQFTRNGALAQEFEPWAEENQAANRSHSLNRRQIEQDTISAALVKKLMLTDEVLATRDPEQVWQAYQSIRNAGSSVSTDESMLKILLRQATSTQGLDIDTATAVRRYHQMGDHSRAQPSTAR